MFLFPKLTETAANRSLKGHYRKLPAYVTGLMVMSVRSEVTQFFSAVCISTNLSIH
jgi:hypothetical protein